MSTLNATTSVQNGKLQFQLDGEQILNDTGSVTKQLKDGTSYVVQWFVIGVPGTDYSVIIDSPGEAKIHLTRTLKNDGHDYGGFRFKA